MKNNNSPIVLAFSGGLDTSFCVPWLMDTYERPVVTATINTGGLTAADADALSERADALGAKEHFLIDAREEFFNEVLKFPSIFRPALVFLYALLLLLLFCPYAFV